MATVSLSIYRLTHKKYIYFMVILEEAYHSSMRQDRGAQARIITIKTNVLILYSIAIDDY